jgi:hypothetical protein
VHTGSQTVAEPQLAAATDPAEAAGSVSNEAVGLVPAAPDPPRKLREMSTPSDGTPLFGGTMPLQDISLPGGAGVFGIPEIVLAAYRNAELALASSDPGCGLSWTLLAGIGKIESNHASNGRTDANGTTVGVIYGPALDGTLPGNEVLKASDGGYVRAIGPMQFLPGTWAEYASDGRGNGRPDPNNVFDAALAAGKYLCSGGLNLRDPQQQVRAVLRYNNSAAYASEVLSWANAYKNGGVPTQVTISPDLIPPGSETMPEGAGSQMTAANMKVTTTPGPATQPPVTAQNNQPAPTPGPVMINVPGLPPIPCGIFCPAPQQPTPCDPATVPAPAQSPDPNNPLAGFLRWAPGALAGQPNSNAPAKPGDPNAKTDPTAADPKTDPKDPNAQQPQQPASCTQPQTEAQQQQQAAPGKPDAQQTPSPGQANNQQQPPAPAKTPAPAPAAPSETPAPAPTVAPPPPGITLPFGIVIPLPAAPR